MSTGPKSTVTASDSDTDNRDGLLVPERFIPTPRSISPEAQAFLSGIPPVAQEELPDLDDKAAWRAYAREADRQVGAFAEQRAKPYPADVETHRLKVAPLYEITPKNLSADNERRAILFIHGGGFVMGGGDAAVYAAMPMAGRARVRVYSLDYRMPPDHPFPAGLDDAMDAYRFLLERYKPENLAVYGESAGGSLAPATILKARDTGLPMPAACALHSPASDATESGDSINTNTVLDTVLKHPLPKIYRLYANGHDLKNPLISPLYGDFSKGFPPTILTTGTRDLLLSSTVLLHRALRRAGITAELHVFEAMTHAPFFDAPEEDELYDETVQFMLRNMGAG